MPDKFIWQHKTQKEIKTYYHNPLQNLGGKFFKGEFIF